MFICSNISIPFRLTKVAAMLQVAAENREEKDPVDSFIGFYHSGKIKRLAKQYSKRQD